MKRSNELAGVLFALQVVSNYIAVAQQCMSGLNTLVGNNNQPVTCNPQDPTSCSSQRPGYFCQIASTGNAFVCCGMQSFQCGSNSPQLSSSGQPVQCTADTQCLMGYSCTQSVCCPASGTGTVQIGQQCSASYQCAGKAICFNSACTCPTGTTPSGSQCVSSNQNGNCPNGQVLVNGMCIQQSALGQPCNVQQQCPTNAQCMGTCQCSQGFQQSNGQCVQQGTNNNCPTGQVVVNNQCMYYSSPGSSCLSSAQCLEGASCVNSICQCQNGKIQLNGYCITYNGGPCPQYQVFVNSQCYTYSIPGAQCVVTNQCVGGSQCGGSTCQCLNGYTSMYGYCVPSSGNNGGVTCPNGQVAINGQCYNTVPLNGFCMYTQQCLQGSCQNGVCTFNGGNNCGTNQVLINGLCYDTVPIGYSCTYAQQCLGGSTCLFNRCTCPTGSVNTNGYCSGGNNGSSNCQSYQVLVNNMCMDQMPIGMSCSVSQQCIQGASCQSSMCQCNSGSTYNGQQCATGLTPMCGAGYASVSGSCRALRSIGQTCSVSAECLSFATCINSFCQCPQGATTINGVCRTSTNSQCGSNGVLINNQCYPTAQIGAGCQFTQQCLGNSQCMSGQCQCPAGTVNQGGTCSGSSSQYTCTRSGYYAPLQNGQPINCLQAYCPDQYNSVCEYNYQVQYYICCTKQAIGK